MGLGTDLAEICMETFADQGKEGQRLSILHGCQAQRSPPQDWEAGAPVYKGGEMGD